MKLTAFLIAALCLWPAAATAQANLAIIVDEGARTLASGEVGPGEPLISIPVKHRETGILKTDAKRLGVMFNAPLVLPAGTQVYRTSIRRVISSGGVATDVDSFDAWCGVRPSSREGGKAVGACVGRPLAPDSGEFMAARWIGIDLDDDSSPYYASDFGIWSILIKSQPTPEIEVTNEPLPVRLHLIVSIDKWTKEGVRIRTGVSDGAATSFISNATIAPAADGSYLVRQLGAALKLTRLGESERAKVEVVTPLPGPS